jgi:predicted transcriptional regulator
VQLRLSPELIARVDTVRGTRRVPPSRHHWILEAIHEKLEREEEHE